MSQSFTDRLHADRWRLGFALTLVLLTLAILGVQAIAAVRAKVENPHGSFKEECALCHSAEGWKPARVKPEFDHGKRYGFALTGAHATDDCLSCHTTLEFKQSNTQCQSCHQDPHRGEMGAECARCHSSRSFSDRSAMVQQHQMSRFPLTGSHAALECEGCHRPSAQGKLQFVNTQAECQTCHLTDYQAARAPDHQAGGFPTECTQCHTTLTWSTARFDHDRSAFPLTGAHRTTTCVQCHGDGVYRGKPKDCYSCHQLDYTRATVPNHVQAQFPQQCAMCHTTTAFQPSSYNHDLTAFPLTGAHRTQACVDCHSNGVYRGTPTDCYSCHQSDYTGTTTPNHVQAQFPQQCAVCHNTTAFQPAAYNHDLTAFPLTGAHRAAACNDCHGDGVYRGKSGACESCHTTDYNATTNPSHTGAHFPMQCATCHGTTAWTPSTWNHDTSFFPIYTGRHRSTWDACSDCHTNSQNYQAFTCLSCHPHSDKTKTDGDHRGERNYSYTSAACYSCHPRGNS